MKMQAFAERTSWLDANPRFYDRLLAVCSMLLLLGMLCALYLALKPSLNPQPRGSWAASDSAMVETALGDIVTGDTTPG